MVEHEYISFGHNYFVSASFYYLLAFVTNKSRAVGKNYLTLSAWIDCYSLLMIKFSELLVILKINLQNPNF